MNAPRLLVLVGGAAAAAVLSAVPAWAQAVEQYGVVLRTTNSLGEHTERIRIQDSVGISRVLLVNAYLDAGAQRIQNVGTPTLPTDAATMGYVDAQVASLQTAVAGINRYAKIANSAGAVQFTSFGEDTLRFASGNGLSVSFNMTTEEISYAIPNAAITDAHLAGSIDPSKISGTALTASSPFDEAAGSDLTVSGSYNSLNLQLIAGSITDTDIAGPISASKIQDVWVNTSGDSMTGQLVADAGVAVPTGQELRVRAAADPNWSLRTTSGLGELYIDITAESLAGDTRAWRLRDLAGAGATRFRVDALSGAVTVTGALSMSGQKITDMADPTADQDAATRGWVLGQIGAGMGITSLNGQTGPLLTLETAAGSGLLLTAAADTITINSDLLNAAAASDYVHWNVLAGIPAGFADGVDDNTTYTAGSGLDLTGTEFSILPGGVTDAHIAGSIDPAKITGTALTQTSTFAAAAASDASVSGTFGALDLQLKPGSVTDAEITGPIAASKVAEVWVDAAGDTMTGALGIGQAPAPGEQLIVVGAQGSIIIR